MNIKILFLAANPLDISHLRLDEEMRAIDTALRQAEYRDRYVIQSHWAVRIDDLQELLLRHQPDVVHFSGHGTPANEIVLQDAHGNSAPVSSAALRNLFRLFKENISCVVLNACYSAGQAQAIAQHIPVVIGMSDAITDTASINFAAAFYRALGYGRPVQAAFELGCNQIELTGLPEQDKPQLLTQHAKPEQITIPGNLLQSGDHHLWALLTIVPLVILAYYLFQILYRWIDIDLAFLNFVVTGMQPIALLIVIYGLTTDNGQEAVRTIWGNLVARIPQLRHTRNVCLTLAGATLLVALVFHISSPILARQSNTAGLTALDQGRYTEALANFQRAVRIAPRMGRYHFNLGLTYETAGADAEAIGEYEFALQLDDTFWPTYNNLGRLRLINQNDADGALQVLRPGLTLVERLAKDEVLEQTQLLLAQGVLHKNIGWAQFVKGLPREAVTQLAMAEESLLALQAEGADQGAATFYLTETYRLMALAYEALDQPVEALHAWGNVEGYGLTVPAATACTEYDWLTNFFCTDAENWVAEAREKLAQYQKNSSTPGDQE